MVVKFKNCVVEVWKLRHGTLVLSENSGEYYYIKGFKNLRDNNPILILEPCQGGNFHYISSCLLMWLEPH